MCKNFELEINNKEIQTESSMTTPEKMSVSTQKSLNDIMIVNNFGTHFNIEPFNYVGKVEEPQFDYERNHESEYHRKEREYDNDSYSDIPSDCSVYTPSQIPLSQIYFGHL